MNKIKERTLLVGIILLHLLLIFFLKNILYPIHFVSQNLFISELIGKPLKMPDILLPFFSAGNIILLWFISKHFFTSRYSLIASVVYAISPWSIYLVIANSFYIYLSFLLLLSFVGLFLISFGHKFWIVIIALGGLTLALYSSIFSLLIIPLLFSFIVIFKIIPFNRIKSLIIFLFILSLPLFFFISKNSSNLNNIFNSEVKIFSDPGLLNMVNGYQGAARQANLGNLAKISENKYIFFAEYIFLKFVKNYSLLTYFTPQEKLLNFSFSPPVFLGFLIPFIYGLYQIFKSSRWRMILLLSILLVIPSLLAKSMVDLNRLFILMPVVVMVIAFGLTSLFEQRGKKTVTLLLALSLLLVIVQILVTISDIPLREKDRFIEYFGQNYEIGKQ